MTQDPKRGWWWKPSIEQAEQTYQAMLESVAQEDFSDLDDMGFLQVCGDDKRGRPVVMVAAKLYQAKIVTQARTLRYLVAKLHSVVQEPYTLLWLHTQSNYWNNCPSTWWLWRTYESLPSVYRSNLMQLHVLHCDLSLWSSISVALPWYSEGLWSKVNWVSRVEFLWDTIDKRVLLPYLPEYVIEHDHDLEEQPLADYGLIASKELATALPGAPAPPM